MQEVINLINQFIIANNNKEITANVLNPILKAIVNQPNELIGALDQSSVTGDTIVDKLNTLINLVNQFETLQVISGENDPNIIAPDSFSIGDFYNRNIQGNTFEFYQYNGNEWVLIRNLINDNATGLDTVWSSAKTLEMINNKNQFIITPSGSVSGNTVTVNGGGQWRINTILYANQNAINLTVPFSAPGMIRIDNILANENNAFEIQQGVEVAGNPTTQTAPANKLLLRSITVTDSAIVSNSDAYKNKSENGVVYISASGILNSVAINNDHSHLIVTNATKIESLTLEVNAAIYPGKIYKITNQQTKYLTLANLSNVVGVGNTKLSFILNRDYYVLPNETLEFYLSESLNTLVFLGSNRPIENSITINSNTTFTNAHHGATLYVLANVNLTFSAPSVLVPDFEVAIKTHTAGVANVITTGWVVSAPDGKKLEVNTMGFIGRIPNTDTLSFGGGLFIMNQLKKVIFSTSSLKPNTFIGGIGLVVQTKSALANKLGVSETIIKKFAVVDGNIEAYIKDNYVPRPRVFENDTLVTYFNDAGGKIVSNGLRDELTEFYRGAVNLKSSYIPNYLASAQRMYDNTAIEILDINNATMMSYSSIVNNRFLKKVLANNINNILDFTTVQMNISNNPLLEQVEGPNFNLLNSYFYAYNTSLKEAIHDKAHTVRSYAFFRCASITRISLKMCKTMADNVFVDIKLNCQIDCNIALKTSNNGAVNSSLLYAKNTRQAVVNFYDDNGNYISTL